ncbi:MAG TPA: hypothetical protein VFI65_24615 [Streptosporangiaceae bacterium]|nr:hypothetical protein [Streptosporangiaceae bacterium]
MVTRNQNLDQRMNWFDRQFLRAQDFADESDYQVDRLRRHTRTLHTPGVAEGLAVTGQPGDGAITVGPGTAVDDQGREIVLLSSLTKLALPSSATAELYICYSEAQTSPSQDPGVTGYTRVSEIPQFIFRETAPGKQPVPGSGVLLAALSLKGGSLTSAPDVSGQTRAGAAVGDVGAFSVTLKAVGQPASAWPRLTASGPNQVAVAGDLRLTGQGGASGALTLPGPLTLNDVTFTAPGQNKLQVGGDLTVMAAGSSKGNLSLNGTLILQGGLQFGTAAAVTAISRDTSLSQNRDTAVPTEAAVKSYVDHRLGVQIGRLRFHNIVAGAAWQRQTIQFNPRFAASPQIFVAAFCAEGFSSTAAGYDSGIENVSGTQADITCACSAGTVAQLGLAWLAFGPIAELAIS